MTLHREPVDICEVIARALEVSRALVLARQHTLAISFADEAVIVEGDLARLTQAVSKLVNNAAEYTDKGGHIWLDARREEHVAVITVRDDGMGISADLLPHVFDLFAPVDSSPGRSNHGLSLGLTLARQLVELHDGAVNVRSSGPGQGSEFAVRLPLLNSSAATTVIAQPLANEAGGPSLRILLIEDLNDVAEMLAFLLTCSGHDVRIANNGQAALELADTFGPQIVISDIGLPGMSGHEVARRLRERPAFRSTPLIALSGYGRAEDRQRSMDAGFDRHLVKPVDPEALERLVRSFPPSAM